MDDAREDGLLTYRHARDGFSLPLPPDWELSENVDAKVAMVAAEPDEGEGFRANVVVTVDEVAGDMTASDWQALNDQVSAQMMDEYMLLDSEVLEMGGHEVFRRLAHHTVDQMTAVTIQQWSTIRGARGYTLTTSVGSLALSQTAALFDRVAREFSIEMGGA